MVEKRQFFCFRRRFSQDFTVKFLPRYLVVEVGEAVADFSIFLRLSRCKERAIREVGQNTAEPKTTLYNINKNYT